MSEAKLQQRCVIWFKNTYPEKGKRLFAVINEGRDVTTKLGVGMTPGVSDLLYVDDVGYLHGIEMKEPGSSHSVQHLIKQAKWMREVLGDRGRFVDSFEDFQSLMLGGDGGVDAWRVLDYLGSCKKRSIIWNKDIFDGYSITKEIEK